MVVPLIWTKKFCIGRLEISGWGTNSNRPSAFGHLSSEEKSVFILPLELKKYSILESKQDNRNNSTKNVQSKIYRYKVESYIYSFDNLDTILQLCETAKSENLFFGRNSLYKLEDTYFVIFSQATIKNKKFLKNS